MKGIWLVVLGAVLIGCAPSIMTTEIPEQVVGPEYHYLVMDGVS